MTQWISVIGILQQNNLRCMVCIVYAPNDHNGRLEVLNQLRLLRTSNQAPMILMGDFNEVVCPQERRGARNTTIGMRELRQFIQDMNMMDMEINMKFTWMRRNAASRIDRAMIDTEFVEIFPGIKAHCKDRMLSDHHPLLLALSTIAWGSVPFRSLDYWLQEPSFVKYLKKSGCS